MSSCKSHKANIPTIIDAMFKAANIVSPGTSAINLAALTDETVTWLPAQKIANNCTEEDLYQWARSLLNVLTLDIK